MLLHAAQFTISGYNNLNNAGNNAEFSICGLRYLLNGLHVAQKKDHLIVWEIPKIYTAIHCPRELKKNWPCSLGVRYGITLSSDSQSDTNQPWASLSSCKWKRAENIFLWVCSASLWPSMTAIWKEALVNFSCFRGSMVPHSSWLVAVFW